MDKYLAWLAVALALAAGALLGAYFSARKQHAAEMALRRIPRRWPIEVRRVANSRERRVLIWMNQAFPEYQVMLKMPITRFTLPDSDEDGRHWFEVLNSVYCTFTLCNSEGRVLACVDVPSPGGLSLSNEALKHSVLMHCGIPYSIVDAQHLPLQAQIRAELLGEHPDPISQPPRDSQSEQFEESRSSLQATVSRQRSNKSREYARLEATLDDSLDASDSIPHASWQQDSFIAPLDSRAAELR